MDEAEVYSWGWERVDEWIGVKTLTVWSLKIPEI
jgi:hypothetical protein